MGTKVKPFRVLQERYDPPVWKAYRIGRDLTRLTRRLGLKPLDDKNHRQQVKAAWCNTGLMAYVRRRTVKNPKAAQWHQDGDLDNGVRNSGIVLWTSNTPTEVKGLDGTVYTIPNRAVVLVHNDMCYHRRPGDAPKVRYLFRQRVAKEV